MRFKAPSRVPFCPPTEDGTNENLPSALCLYIMLRSKASNSSFHFQDRDLAVIRGLFESRVMTTLHVARLYFDGRLPYARKRLLVLKNAGLIGERERSPFAPALLFLARQGLRLLDGRGVLLEYPPFSLPALERRSRVSEMTLRHELAVIDVKASVVSATRGTKTLSAVEFSTWPLLNQFMASSVTVKPDGFIRITESNSRAALSNHSFFLEVDCSTEAPDNLVTRAKSYLEYYHSGGFAERNNAPRSAFNKFPFRVLMVFNTTERLNNVAERLLQTNPPILTHVWLTTLPEILKAPLGSIWVRPLDYRNATSNSRFEPATKAVARHYSRDVARDSLVAERIKKHPLITV